MAMLAPASMVESEQETDLDEISIPTASLNIENNSIGHEQGLALGRCYQGRGTTTEPDTNMDGHKTAPSLWPSYSLRIVDESNAIITLEMMPWDHTLLGVLVMG